MNFSYLLLFNRPLPHSLRREFDVGRFAGKNLNSLSVDSVAGGLAYFDVVIPGTKFELLQLARFTGISAFTVNRPAFPGVLDLDFPRTRTRGEIDGPVPGRAIPAIVIGAPTIVRANNKSNPCG